MIEFTGTYTDQYQLSMAQVYFLKGFQRKPAVFDYFFRALPYQGGYAVFSGLDDVLDILENLRFNPEDIEFLQSQEIHPEFLNYLQHFQFKGTIYSTLEGNVVFPTCPVLRVEANLIEAQIIETILLNVLNFQTLIATKARRIRDAAGNRTLIDFGLRRAQGPGGYYASRASIVGGFNATSNVRAGRDFAIPVSGTMAHSFIQSYESELQAFQDYAECWPEHCVLLVDTYSTLTSGVPNAIKVAKQMEKRGHQLKGIRLDSGDLAWLAKRARQMLDDAGLPYVSIIASNQLDEFVIKNLIEQEAPIDAFGVGTNLAIGSPDGALDGVYKLALLDGKPRIKLSDTYAKITLPSQKQVLRILEKDGSYQGADMITLVSEKNSNVMHHPFEEEKSFAIKSFEAEPLLQKVMANGKRLFPRQSLVELKEFSQRCFDNLPGEYKRFVNPHLYKVGISTNLKQLRDQLIIQYKRSQV
ncbi:nicotinate phosphoribosyltransferase [Legionella waltersii]|uniref:Nicotinate phosphoribosyltransferase n=1 Tax=Legionella waltersii TaxID=66969 RepID=A0A0W1ADJ8_9GAMM|nr:nicotinate phosphoribosyltransferase [Legionella waltersii]KTD79413.1 nicotinate phosphoribosyltransferase [Legionella waltersii]SNU97804.1 nicotinate phosphoribosyltransferase [Legionella waltersii]